MEHPSIEEIWAEYKRNHPEAPDRYEAWAFGDSKEMADELLRLVLAGTKTATASNYLMYELQQEELPYVGQHNILLNGDGEAAAIVETISVEVIPFDEVTEEFAYLEGEGDRSLAYWREVHEAFFTREMEQIDREFDERMLVVCERFRLVYKD